MRTGEVAKMVGPASGEVSKIIKGLKKKGKVTSPQKMLLCASIITT